MAMKDYDNHLNESWNKLSTEDRKALANNNLGLIESKEIWNAWAGNFTANVPPSSRHKYNIHFDRGEIPHNNFNEWHFPCGVSFQQSQFSKGMVSFCNAQFETGTVLFNATKFGKGGVDFSAANFGNSHVLFNKAEFGSGIVNFTRAQFSTGAVSFEFAIFGKGDVKFDYVKFNIGDLIFNNATFGMGNLTFDYCSLTGRFYFKMP